jgi:hypothetical protein
MWLLMLEYPEITSDYILSAVQTARSCQTVKMTKYYNKLVGGVTCSNAEQLKMALLTYILEQVYKLDMTCFDTIPTDSTLSYIRSFINYMSVECADCGFSFSGQNSSASADDIGLPINDIEPEVPADDGLNYILLEDSTEITIEDASGSLLMETT